MIFYFLLQGIILLTQQAGECIVPKLLRDIVLGVAYCVNGFLNYRDGTCTSGCSSPYQKQSGSYCYDFDDETPYSQYLIKEYINTAADPGQYAQYTLISQSGTNFLKGSDIYYSYFQRIRIFGGPFIWSQAKFQRIHNIITPHHSLTIAFYIVYGPTFPSDGNFIYSIENNTPVSKSTASYYSTYSDGAKYDKVYEKINHNSNTLTITWECFGPNNEPIKAYCGFYNYYIAVHNCQPYCLQCSNQSTCTQWNSTYNINIVKFSQAECQINQYYDKESVRCFDCPSSCLTCTSKIDCQTCQPTYTQSKLGCTCTMNQYEDSNQCFNCPIECNQCLSSTYCIECLISNNRQLLNGQCICIDGSFLTNNNICIPICGDSLIVSGEQCENSSILPYKGCINCQARCQSSCLTCSTSGIGCLSCKDGYNRIDNLCYSICGDKIITEDEQCDDGNLIIGDGCHNCQFSCQESCIYCIQGVCYDCQEGYRIISFKCYPICGDGVQKYNEQCDTLQNQQKCKSCQFTCDLNCYFCQFGLCQQCLDGYELSSDQFYCVKSFQYNSIEIENCQIQIGIDFIQCHNYTNFGKVEQKYYFEEAPLSFCQYQHKLSPNLYFTYCFDHCAACDENNCISCQSGYYFNDSFSCISSYGIGILAHDEHCEMDNQNCLSCMFNAPKLCELYFEDTCFKCENGYYINQFTNICESKCGDGIITHDEQCEDNNYIQFDGCYYCKYSCSQQCLNCINGLCQKCNQNYQLLDGFCYVEENGIEYLPECEFNINGECLTCQKDYKLDLQGACISICSESCIQCHYGQCFECAEQYELYENICIKNRQCQKGLYFNQELQICESLCGDGFINGWEECDDQNMQQFDGCYQCKFECDEHCIECIYGECFQCSQEFNLNENKCQSKCQETCLNCAQGGCQLCSNGYLLDEYFNCIKITCQYDLSCTTECGNGIIENLEQCDDQNLINDDSCNNQCEQTCDVNCTQCIEGICYECKEGWRLGLFFCESICGDQILVGNEECDDCNQNSYDGCFQCKFQCTQYCEICLNGICQSCQINYELDLLNNKCKSIQPVLAIYEQPNCKLLNNNQYILCQFGCLDLITSTLIIDYNMNKCSKNCKLCLLSQCLECEFGYYGNKCMPKCGDGIIVQEEECDDGNQYEVDTCLNCKYQCPLYCKLCAYGVCTHCFEGFYLDIVSISCNPICGDTILSGNEACDDGNELTYDGCFKCNYQCQMECLNCFFGKCMECESPLIVVQAKGICEQLKQCEGLIGLYYDDFSNDCLPLCGDGIVVGNEQCEDLNNTPYDGCYDCKYQCQIGSLLNQTSCIPICGDGIVIDEYEECDDQNDQPYDGCFECQFQCIQNCLVCQKGICLKCDIDFSFKNNQCLLNIQNDNIELSQDNNDSIINSQNLQELLFYGNSLCRKSECVYSQKPNMKLTYQDQQFALQYIEITYDEQVKYGDQIIKDQDLFNISISDLDSQNYDITINTIQEMSFDLQYAYFQQNQFFLFS
ncbi:unnamed protein product [Paramecium sonneborni]|uniref:Insulin-like growth factor binding protein, N-terminal n=1 Tax=Paramecium sonneborni TaxID=65129 RepID=A0A8S1RU57_9CILI|nr:unnamed protein product [Paramecium sonneborni]